jgi:integrase
MRVLRGRRPHAGAAVVPSARLEDPRGQAAREDQGALRDALVGVRAKAEHVDQDAYVFATRTGGRPSGDNVRARVLNPAVARANKSRAKRDLPPLPDKLTPHSLRRTSASVL